MAPINTDEALGHTIRTALKSQLVIGLLGLSVGGSGGTYLATRKTDPRLDSLVNMVSEMKPRVAVIQPLQDTVKDLANRTTDLEEWRGRLAYLPPRKQSIGRSYER